MLRFTLYSTREHGFLANFAELDHSYTQTDFTVQEIPLE